MRYLLLWHWQMLPSVRPVAAPLGVVNGYLELLGDMTGDEADGQARKWIASATRAVARMQTLIESLLTLTLGAGILAVHIEAVGTAVEL